MQTSLHAALRDNYILEDQFVQETGTCGPRRSVIDDPANQDNRQLFFAKVLRSATEDEVRRLFGQFGKVTDVNLFRAFQGAPTTKGCGLVTMGSHSEAVAAIGTLDSKYVWAGMETPMVVKWMDTALQRRRREAHLASMRQALAGGVSAAEFPYVPGGLALATSIPVPTSLGGLVQNSFLDALEPAETPPPGCAHDAIKLFVGNVPKSCSEDQLLPLFQSVGKVVELVIVHDKVTHESKGSAFVWFASRADAERAILQFNFRHVLPDPTGDQDRPLVVRRAKTRAKAGKGLSGAPASPLLASLPQVTMGASQSPTTVSTTQPFYKPHSHQQGVLNGGGAGSGHLVGLSGLETLQMTDAGLAAQLAAAHPLRHQQQEQQQQQQQQEHQQQQRQPQGATGGYGSLGALGSVSGGVGGSFIGYRTLSSLAGQYDIQSAIHPSMYDAYVVGDSVLDDFSISQTLHQNAAVAAAAQYDMYGAARDAAAAAAAAVTRQQQQQHSSQSLSHAQQRPQQQIAQSMTLNQNQLTMLNTHLFSVQAVSGAQLHISPGAPGLFNLVVSGSKSQVETAKGLILTVLGHA